MPAIDSTDLIVAPATAAAGGGRGIVRIAGENVRGLLTVMISPAEGRWPEQGEPPRLIPGSLHPAGLGREWGGVPVAVLLWPGPRGPLRGPLAEVHLPGSPPLVAAFVAEACRHGARLARGGEFSLRAFLAGTLDLLQAEAVLAVVDAQTPAQLAAALDRMAGGAGRALEALRSTALDLVADVEAAIDFADEATPDAVPVGVPWEAVARRVEDLIDGLADVSRHLVSRDAVGAEGLPRAVLVGRPNIGKSSLFNALVGHAAALVADEIGTTRDWIAAPLHDAAGQPACMLIDIAGLDAAPPPGSLAATAVARAADEIARADVIVACRDAAERSGDANEAVPAGRRVVRVITRADRVSRAASPEEIASSGHTGAGIEQVRRAILEAAAEAAAERAPATMRMRAGVEAAAAALGAARKAIEAAGGGVADEAVVAGCLHQAIDAIDDVTGRELGSDLLDRIFSRHCIGK